MRRRGRPASAPGSRAGVCGRPPDGTPAAPSRGTIREIGYPRKSGQPDMAGERRRLPNELRHACPSQTVREPHALGIHGGRLRHRRRVVGPRRMDLRRGSSRPISGATQAGRRAGVARGPRAAPARGVGSRRREREAPDNGGRSHQARWKGQGSARLAADGPDPRADDASHGRRWPRQPDGPARRAPCRHTGSGQEPASGPVRSDTHGHGNADLPLSFPR